MTFATIDSRETTTVKMGNIRAFGAAVLAWISEYLAERKELRSLDSYHTENAARLEQAQRELNQFWLR